jgi:clan AA aspartic protease (TIGR02281 family)
MVPVRINGAITLNFLLDTGATVVAIPGDVFLTLMRTGTLKTSDFLGTETYTLADGTEHVSKRFVLRELKVGDHVIRNVIATVLPVQSDHPLLGQSFLSKLPFWTIDNVQHVLVLSDQPGSVDAARQRAALPPVQTMPPAPATAPPAVSSSRSISPEELFEHGMKAFAGKDYIGAMGWLSGAANKGSAAAQSNIGLLYENGLGVARDYSEAMRWFRMAAEKGNAAAQNNIGRMVAKGEGVGRDCAIAKQWLERAAAAGSETARNNIRSGVDGACRW